MASETLSYRVPGVSCEHCRSAIAKEVGLVPGVESVEVDLEQKLVTVTGHDVHDESVRSAIDDAGYEIAHLQPDAR